MGATVVDRTGASDYASSFLTTFIESLGFKLILVRSDNERSLLSLIEKLSLIELVTCSLTGVELMLMTSPEGDHQANGFVQVGVREIKVQMRILRIQLKQRLGSRTGERDPLMSWIPRHGANCVSRYRIMEWWSLVSQYTSDQSERTMHCEEETRDCLEVSMWDSDFPHARWCEERNENCKNDVTRELGSRVQCNVCWSSLAIETGSTESVETCCT